MKISWIFLRIEILNKQSRILHETSRFLNIFGSLFWRFGREIIISFLFLILVISYLKSSSVLKNFFLVIGKVTRGYGLRSYIYPNLLIIGNDRLYPLNQCNIFLRFTYKDSVCEYTAWGFSGKIQSSHFLQ